jgi:hypothetical protein
MEAKQILTLVFLVLAVVCFIVGSNADRAKPYNLNATRDFAYLGFVVFIVLFFIFGAMCLI